MPYLKNKLLKKGCIKVQIIFLSLSLMTGLILILLFIHYNIKTYKTQLI